MKGGDRDGPKDPESNRVQQDTTRDVRALSVTIPRGAHPSSIELPIEFDVHEDVFDSAEAPPRTAPEPVSRRVVMPAACMLSRWKVCY